MATGDRDGVRVRGHHLSPLFPPLSFLHSSFSHVATPEYTRCSACKASPFQQIMRPDWCWNCAVFHIAVCVAYGRPREDTQWESGRRVTDETPSRYRMHITAFSICVASLLMHTVSDARTCSDPALPRYSVLFLQLGPKNAAPCRECAPQPAPLYYYAHPSHHPSHQNQRTARVGGRANKRRAESMRLHGGRAWCEAAWRRRTEKRRRRAESCTALDTEAQRSE